MTITAMITAPVVDMPDTRLPIGPRPPDVLRPLFQAGLEGTSAADFENGGEFRALRLA
jgi:hypothetical protein